MNFYEVIKVDGETEMINPQCIVSMKDHGESISVRMCDGSVGEYKKDSVVGMCVAANAGMMSIRKEEV